MAEPRDHFHRSSLADHPDIRGVLPRFVARLPDHVRRLRALQAQAEEGAGNAGGQAELQQLLHQLRGTGKSYGFAGLSDRAAAAEEALLAGGPRAAVDHAVAALIEYLQRVEGYEA